VVGSAARPFVPFAYTRDVRAYAKRLTSVATAFALSGLPAVLTACMALCLQATSVAVTHSTHGVSGEHHASSPAPAVATGHAHHGAPTAQATRPSAGARVSNPGSPSSRLHADCVSCCLDGVVLAAGPRVERLDTHAGSAGSMVVPPATVSVMLPVHDVAPEGPPPSPPTLTRVTLVLRV
jgi:hypothetical protein